MARGPAAFGNPVRRIRNFWNQEIWQRQRYPLSWPPALGRGVIIVARTVYVVVTGFGRERLRTQAAALTYVTLLSLIPALAVVFSIFTAFGGLVEVHERLREFLFQALAVNQREVVADYIERFVLSANAGQLGAIGTVFLFVTVTSLLSDIERAFNDIWGVSRGRTLVQRIQVYWPLLTVGPLLLAVSFSFTAAVAASSVVQTLEDALLGVRFSGRVATTAVTCLFFTFLYHILPNTAVRWKSSIVGGFIAGVLWLVAQQLYAVYATRAITYSAIYGSLSAVPLFIIWVYVSWLITLLGASMTFAVQSAKTFEPERDVSQAEREQVAMQLALAVAVRYIEGEGAVPAQELIDEARVPPRVARTVLEALVDGQVLAESRLSQDIGYLPDRPLGQLTLQDVVHVLRGESAPELLFIEHSDPSRYAHIAHRALEESESRSNEVLSELTLEEWARRCSMKKLSRPA